MKLSTVLWRKAAQALVVAPRQVLCKLSDLEIDVGKEVFLCSGAARSLILLLRENNNSNSNSNSKTPFPRISAYINMCPHVGVPLNMFPDLFLTTDKVTAQRTCSLVFFSRSFRLSLIPAPSHPFALVPQIPRPPVRHTLQQHILCCAHGAIFNKDDGLCVGGPCEGQSLTPVMVSIEAVGSASTHTPESAAARGQALDPIDPDSPGDDGCDQAAAFAGAGAVVVLTEQNLPEEMTIPRTIKIPPPSKRRLRRLQQRQQAQGRPYSTIDI